MKTVEKKPGAFGGIAAICSIAFGLLLVSIGAILVIGGMMVAELGGSFYYVITGGLLVGAGVGFCLREAFGFYLYTAAFILTMLWAIWEIGFNGWALTSRLACPFFLTIIAVLLLPTMPIERAAAPLAYGGIAGRNRCGARSRNS